MQCFRGTEVLSSIVRRLADVVHEPGLGGARAHVAGVEGLGSARRFALAALQQRGG